MNTPTATECFAIAVAESFQFQDLARELMEQERATLYRDSLHVDRDGRPAFVFAYGVVVTWQWSSEERDTLLKHLQRYLNNPYQEVESERFNFSIHAEPFRIQRDHIFLNETTPLHFLALSHALAQSVKLSTFETLVSRTMQATAHIPRALAETGNTHLTRTELAKIRGRLFLTKSDIIVRYDLLDTPEFFWEYPEMEPTYQQVANYLEIRNRTQVLSTRLTTVHELFEMLADEQKHKHSASLEWIIIWLIAVEILMFVVNDFLIR